MAIAVASVATTLITGVVYADEKNGKPFEAIWDAIYNLESNTLTNVYSVQKTESIPGGIATTVKATCNSGDKVLGGGYENNIDATILEEKPDGNNGWIVIFDRNSSGVSKFVTVHAMCATMPP
jgi:hypothetical protein